MSINRRDFLRNGSFAAVGLSLPFLSKANFLDVTAGFKIPNFGIQLWTVKENMMEDAKGTLAKLASFGYKQIESYEGPQGMFWGMGHKGFKSYIDDLGMKIVSSHCDNLTDFDKKSEEAAAIGMKYLICPHKGAQKSLDNFKAFAEEFNESGKIAKKHGIKFAYHNHDYSFIPMDGQMPQDVMMQGTDPSLVDFEMDIYWVVAAGAEHPARANAAAAASAIAFVLIDIVFLSTLSCFYRALCLNKVSMSLQISRNDQKTRSL